MSIIFLTGATGFIGQQILTQLVERDHQILILIRGKHAQDVNERLHVLKSELRMKPEAKIVAIKGDLSLPSLGISKEDLDKVMESEIMIHAGVPMQVDLSEEKANQVVIEGTNSLLKIAEMIHQKQKLQKFIHIVGFMSPWNDKNFNIEIDDLKRFMPQKSAYERTKFLADLMVRQATQRLEIPLTVINPGTVIGSSETGYTPQLAGFGLLVEGVRKGLFPVIPGGSDHWLPLISVDHLGEFIASVTAWPPAQNQTYFLLDHDTPNIKEIVTIISKELGVKPPRYSIPVPLLQRMMKYGGSQLTGMPYQSMDFISNHSFPTQSMIDVQRQLHLPELSTKESLRFVIADLDYRLSHKQEPIELSQSQDWKRERIGDVTAFVRPGKSSVPWVILHGLFSNLDEFVPLAEALKNETIYLLDLPGFGRSPLPSTTNILEGMIDSIKKVIELFPTKVRFVGHSLGALIATEVAKSLPNQIEQLFLLQPPINSVRYSGFLKYTLRSPKLTQYYFQIFRSHKRMIQNLIDWSQFQHVDEIPLDYPNKRINDMKSPRIRKVHGEVLSYLGSKFKGLDLSMISDIPIRVLIGERDSLYPLDHIEKFLLNQENITLTKLNYAHHFPISHPEETARELLK